MANRPRQQGKKFKPYMPKRRNGATHTARLVDTILDRAIRAKGFAQAEVVKRWRDIVGEDLARVTVPLRLRFPRGARMDGTLVIRAEGAFSPILQHREQQIISRVNSHFGFKAVARISIEQGPLPRTAPPRRPTVRKLDQNEQKRLDALVGEAGESEVRAALRRLGEAVLGKMPPTDRPH